MRKVLNFFKGIVISVWVLVAIVTTILLISYNDYSVSEIGNNSIFIVDIDRLEPTYLNGDLVIVKKASENKYHVGDKAFFYLKNASDKVFINYGEIEKIVEADHAEDSYQFEGNTIIGYGDMMGLANGSIVYHKWGKILSAFESKWGFMFLVILPTIFAIVYEVYSIIEEAKADDKE